ncbi:MAG: C40 family peptidase, partial [Verrucomicrobia bacterium]|nr:C40 family peptidase [Verrucomicrobiota bacterium]
GASEEAHFEANSTMPKTDSSGCFGINIISLPCVDMREGPSEKSQVVSQALFGEAVEVLKKQKTWFFIKTSDHYTGWIREGIVAKERPLRADLEVSRLQAHVYAQPDTVFGPLMTLPFGAPLERVSADERWHQVLLPDGRSAFIQKGDTEPEPFDLAPFSQKFLGLPYTWGGRCSFGFDCSGFIQMLFARMGVALPRDARQQVHCGSVIEPRLLGDLIFWGHSSGDIRHVGMLLDGERFIHTSARENKPYLRISQLSDPEWNGSGFYAYRCARRIDVQTSNSERHSATDRADQTARLLH